MELFDVYSLLNITPVRAQGCYLWDDKGDCFLDLYGGHAVISVGHSHPVYLEKIYKQLVKIGFYSNSVKIPQQAELAEKLGELSGLDSYKLFLCNSGAEANENAMKLASFVTGRSKIISFCKSFHGRTSGAVSITDNPKIIAPMNRTPNSVLLSWNNIDEVEQMLKTEEFAAVIIEGIQGVGGIRVPEPLFLETLAELCKQYGTLLILDEVQSGYGRSGKFFAYQYSKALPDIVTTAKGMGNGFPIGGVLINPDLKPWYGMLGTTFGGNYLACAAGLAVLEIMESEKLVKNAETTGNYLLEKLALFKQIKEVRGKGLMIGLEFNEPIKAIRQKLIEQEHIFTGYSGTNVIRLLPPLTLSIQQSSRFINQFENVLNSMEV